MDLLAIPLAQPRSAPDFGSDYAGSAAPEHGVVLNLEFVLWGVVSVLAAALRLTRLDALPVGPLEGPRAWGAYQLVHGSTTPQWGGDLASGLAALLFRVVGDSARTARLGPALLGVTAVVALALYRPMLGRGAALAAALLLALSPLAVQTARTLGPEAAALPLALMLPPLLWSVLFGGKLERAPAIGLVVGLGLGSGALFSATLIAMAVWLAVECAWLEQPAPLRAWRSLRRNRGLLLLSLIGMLPGLALTLDRYGAGPRRVSFASIATWAGPAAGSAFTAPWHYLPDVLIAYEPLTLALALYGAVLLLRDRHDRRRSAGILANSGGERSAGAVAGDDGPYASDSPAAATIDTDGRLTNPWLERSAAPLRQAESEANRARRRVGERLALIWALTGLVLTAGWLHREPGQLLALVAPLTLLGGVALARLVGQTLARGVWQGSWAMALVIPALGYTLLILMRWASTMLIDPLEALSIALALGGVMVAIGVGAALLRQSLGAPLLATGLLILGAMTLHTATSVAFRGGDEFLTGARTVPEADAVTRALREAAPPGGAIWVDQRLWPALAWPLRSHETRQFVAAPPALPAAVVAEDDPGFGGPARRGVPVSQRWQPAAPSDIAQLLRWWLFRTPWGDRSLTRARVERGQ